MLVCGGAAVPLALMRAFQERHGVRVVQSWGLTEASPLASLALPPASAPADSDEHWHYRDRAGRVVPLVEVRLIDDAGGEVPWDGTSVGEIQLSGPWIASGYYREEERDGKFQGRWFRTGDIGSIDEHGFILGHRSQQGRDQVRRRVDLLARAGVGAREPSGGG
jgi:fatty-acyl-CoA synthase